MTCREVIDYFVDRFFSMAFKRESNIKTSDSNWNEPRTLRDRFSKKPSCRRFSPYIIHLNIYREVLLIFKKWIGIFHRIIDPYNTWKNYEIYKMKSLLFLYFLLVFNFEKWIVSLFQEFVYRARWILYSTFKNESLPWHLL